MYFFMTNEALFFYVSSLANQETKKAIEVEKQC